MDNKLVIVIGAGASGMMAAISAAKEGARVIVFEKMERAGRKIRITGKGKCNLTNTKTWQEFSTHLYPNSRFFKHAFHSFTNSDTVNFFEEIGLKTVVERGDRVFPQSGKASDVADSLLNEMYRLKVDVAFNTSVKEIKIENGKAASVIIKTKGGEEELKTDALIVATGGLSYPATGSTGDGYRFAESCGHKVNGCFPSLTALMPVGYDRRLEGLQLKNCELTLYNDKDVVQREMGDLDFTNNGIEGSIGYKVSRKAVKSMISGNKCSLSIDLKPAVSLNEINTRIKKEILTLTPFTFHSLLRKFLPAQMIEPFIEMNALAKDLNQFLNKSGTEKLAFLLKNWRININSFTSYERAVITAGGVSTDEIVSKTMKSRLIDNLFFAGEVIDIDGDTGGYNLQIAFSTGFLAGKSASLQIKAES